RSFSLGMGLFLQIRTAPCKQGGCPAPADLKNANGSKICAQLYSDDNPYYAQCLGAACCSNKVSSLVVAPRCELGIWSRMGKEGYSHKFNGGVVYRLQEIKKGLLGDWDNSISAYYCK
uniref:Uncharacterized protein n=1 Tax=Gopherus agassizii TaxID=38772 RepID=A0A452HCX1_9SAUR